MRRRKAIYNIIGSILKQIIVIACGLIVPKVIIINFGSMTNGLVSSINQFLQYIVLVEGGVVAVTRSALYKPLVEKDYNAVIDILNSETRFYKRLSLYFILYALLVAVSINYVSNENFGYMYSFSLTLIIAIRFFVEYYFCVQYKTFLHAIQKSYIVYIIWSIVLIINALIIVVTIDLSDSIHLAQLSNSFIFIIQAFFYSVYIRKKFGLPKINGEGKMRLSQQWNAFWHQVSKFLIDHTDIILVTLFLGFNEVSVYATYRLTVNGVQMSIQSLFTGLESMFGDMIAREEKERLVKTFKLFQFTSLSISIATFTTAAILIIPFIQIYTKGITDTNYIRPYFGYAYVIAAALVCVSSVYSIIIFAAGHFKNTQNIAIIEVIINIVSSIILINFYGLSGVVIGTAISTCFKMFSYAYYVYVKIIKCGFGIFLKYLYVFLPTTVAIITISNLLFREIKPENYFAWSAYGIAIFSIALFLIITSGIIFFREELIDLKNLFLIIIKKSSGKQVLN